MRRALFLLVSLLRASSGCDICGPGNTLRDEDGIIEIPGRENRTCRELQDIANSGAISDEQCNELIPFVQVPCDCSGFVCNICGENGELTDPSGIINIPGDDEGLTTCAAVDEIAKARGFNESFCSIVQEIAEEPCGCSQDSITPTASPTESSPSESSPSTPRPTRPPVENTSSRTSEPTDTTRDFPSAGTAHVVVFSISAALVNLFFVVQS